MHETVHITSSSLLNDMSSPVFELVTVDAFVVSFSDSTKYDSIDGKLTVTSHACQQANMLAQKNVRVDFGEKIRPKTLYFA